MSLLLTRVPKMFCWRVLLSVVVVGTSGFSCRSVDVSVSGLLSLNRDKGKSRGKTEVSREGSEESGNVSELSIEFKDGSMKIWVRSTEELMGCDVGCVVVGKLDVGSPRMVEGSVVEEGVLCTRATGGVESAGRGECDNGGGVTGGPNSVWESERGGE